MNYQIQSKTYRNGIWTVKYKKWPEGECFCTATKHTIEIEKQGNPMTKDIIEAENKFVN